MLRRACLPITDLSEMVVRPSKAKDHDELVGFAKDQHKKADSQSAGGNRYVGSSCPAALTNE